MTDKKRLLIFINLMITCVATSFLSTALSAALPPIIEDFGISASTGQWLTSAYSLVMGITMPLTAYLLTRFPTKKLYLFAIAILLVGLIVCTVATSFSIMLVGRIFQAISNGITTSMAQVVLLSIYPPERRGSIMGWYGLAVGAAPVVAPTIAGILTDTIGWRMIFVLASGILLISFIYALLVFDDVLETAKKSFDVTSFIFSIFAFGGLTFGIGNITNGLTQIITWLSLLVGIIGAAAFIYRQFHLSDPFLELRTLKIRDYSVSVMGSMLLYFIMMGTSIIMPLYIQSILGYSATTSGLVTLPGSMVMAVVSPFAGKIFDKMGMRNLAIIGNFALILSSAGMFFVTMDTPLVIPAILNAIRSVAIGCMMMPFVTWGVSSVSKEHSAHANALLTSMRTIAGAIGSAVFVGIMTYVGEKTALIKGLNFVFLVTTVISVAFLVFSILMIGKKKTEKQSLNT